MKAAIFLLSVALLAHEVALLRVLAIATWSHAASLVVAVALLGFGAAGTLLAVAPRLARRGTVAAAMALYAAAAPASLALGAAIDFNVLEVGWRKSEWLSLLALQATFMLPFLFAALAIAVALSLEARRAGGVYAANLLGSGLGALLAAPLLTLGPPEQVVAAAAVTAAAAAALVGGWWSRIFGAAGLVAALTLAGAALPMSPFKDLPAAPNKTILETRHGPLGRIDHVRLPSLHFAPGLSLESPALPPPQEGLFVDGHLVAALDRGASAYLDHALGALPLQLVEEPRVLLLGVGPDLARADFVVDADRNLLTLAERDGAAMPPLSFLEHEHEHEQEHGPWNVILMHVGELDPVHETPLLTVDGLKLALTRSGASGALAVSTRLSAPPRSGPKLLATARQVSPHVIAARSMDRLCVVMRQQAPTEEQLARVTAFCERNGFDIVLPLDARPDEPVHAREIPLVQLPGDYPYDLRPATRARPYFHRFFLWSRLGDLLDPKAIPFVRWPFVSLAVALLQVVVLSAVLLLGPLISSRAARAPAALFLALGLAFMSVEMGFLARATLLLGSPTLAASAVIGGFMVGAGLGSAWGERLRHPLAPSALAAALLGVPAFLAMGASPAGCAFASVLVAVPMGMPFPAALGRLVAPSVPWALAVNGCASVAAASAAPLVSSTFGIPATLGIGLAFYAVVARVGRRRSEPECEATPGRPIAP